MSDEKGLVETLASQLVKSESKSTLKGALAAALSLALLSISNGVPSGWEGWVQWPLYLLFAMGMIKLVWSLR